VPFLDSAAHRASTPSTLGKSAVERALRVGSAHAGRGVRTLSDELESTPNAAREEQLAHFGARVRELREKAGLTQAHLAERAGMDRIAISHIERGQRDVGVVRAAAIARALGVRPGDLFPES